MLKNINPGPMKTWRFVRVIPKFMQALWAFLVFYTHVMRVDRIQGPSFNILCRKMQYIGLLDGTKILQLLLESSLERAQSSNVASFRTAFQSRLYFASMALMSTEVGKENPNTIPEFLNNTFPAMEFALIQKT